MYTRSMPASARRLAALLLMTALAACGSDDVMVTVNDDDGDGVENLTDNCPDHANADQDDQDTDGDGDVCDPSNDNAVTMVANADLEDSDRDANNRTCDDTEALSGITLSLSAGSTYIDSAFYRCTERFAPFTTTEDVGETSPERGPDVSCDADEAVVGIAYKDALGTAPPNDLMDAATLLCAPSEGPDTSPRTVPDTDFDANTGPAITLQCPEGSTAAGIMDIDGDTSSGNSDALDGLGLLCRAGRWISQVAATP